MISFRPSEVGAALEGVQLGHFLLEEFVGGGGMGAVFRGLDTTLGRVVAVKVVSSKNTDEDTLRRFRNEAQSAARLDHPNIAHVYFVGEDQGWNFIVFEFIDGVNVRDLVDNRGPLPVEEAIRYTLQIADALAHASEREVVHRDIKPSNILVTPNGQAKLVDMGLARLRHGDAPANDLTESGVTLGTFDYISPEQARDPRSADVRSDMYSLGCTLYFMLSGLPPFPDGTVLQKLLSHSSDSPPDLRELRPNVGDEVAELTTRLMAKQPEQRHQLPRELIGELVTLADRLGIEGIPRHRLTTVEQVVPWHGRLETHLPWIVSTALLLVAALILHGIWGEPAGSDARPGPPRLGKPAALMATPGSNEETQAVDVGADAEPPATPVAPEVSEVAESSPAEVGAAADGTVMEEVEGQAGNEAERAGPTILDSQEEPTTLFVGSAFVDVDVPGDLVFPTLAAAIQRAGEMPEVDSIELRAEMIVEEPFTVDLRRTLTVRAAPNVEPLIIFRPTEGGLASERSMVKLFGNHRVYFEGIHWRLELPYEPGSQCTLFHLNAVDLVSLTDCTMTVSNGWGVPASFFAVHGSRLAAGLASADIDQVPSPSIELRRTIARGQASLVRATDGLPFWLTWEQGLFASTDRMVEASGLPQRGRADVARVDLINVTASMDEGLCQIRVADAGPFLPALDIMLRECVIVHDATRPLVEYIGVSSLEEALQQFRYGGTENYYASSQVLWRVGTVDGDQYPFGWSTRSQVRWYEERFAHFAVRWADRATPKPAVEEQTPVHYRLAPRLAPGARRLAGFDETLLPELPSLAGAEEIEPAFVEPAQ